MGVAYLNGGREIGLCQQSPMRKESRSATAGYSEPDPSDSILLILICVLPLQQHIGGSDCLSESCESKCIVFSSVSS